MGRQKKKEVEIFYIVQLSRVIFLDRKNRENAIKEARKAAEDIHKKNVSFHSSCTHLIYICIG